jgi:VanZ family protein
MQLNDLWPKKNLFYVLKVLFVFVLVIATYYLLKEMPIQNYRWPYWDKVEHVLMFFFLTFFALMLFAKYRLVIILLLPIYGGLTEYFQSIMTRTRIGSMADWLADVAGVMLGCLLARLFSCYIKRRQQRKR